MSDVVQITDYYSESMAPRLSEQYKPSHAPKLNDLLVALGASADTLEAALFSIRNLYYLATAAGIQLDNIGAIFAEPRNGRDDETYRENIRLKAAQRSFATPEDIISVIKGLWGAGFVQYIPEYPAAAAFVNDSMITSAQLEILSPAGVSIRGSEFMTDQTGANITDQTGTPIRVLI